MPLPIARIKISRFMAVEELEFEPGAVTIFRGKNGRGKSSVARAVLAAFQGAKGEFVREGETEARILIELSDGVTIDRSIQREGKQKPPKIKPVKGPAVSDPARWLAGQVDDLINPLDFLTCDPAKRVQWVLEAVPVRVTGAELLAACGDTMPVADLERAADQHALLAIDQIYRRIYDARRDQNVQARAKRESIKQLEASLPPIDEEATDWAVVEAELAAQAGAIDERLRAESAQIVRAAAALKAGALAQFSAERNRVTARLNEEIAALTLAAEREIGVAKEVRAKAEAEADTGAATAKQQLLEAVAGEREGVADSLGQARSRREEADRAANTRRIMDQFGMEAVRLEDIWAGYNAAMQKLDALRTGLLGRMPVAGIEYRDNRLYRNGLPFEVLNTAQCMDISMEIAELRAGKIGIVVVDGIERLDPESQRLWYERAVVSGLHYIFTEVSNDETLTMQQSVPEVAGGTPLLQISA